MEVEPVRPNPIKLTAYKSNFQLLMLGRESVIHNRPAATRRTGRARGGGGAQSPTSSAMPRSDCGVFLARIGRVWHADSRIGCLILAACHPVINQQKRLTQWRTSSRRRSVS